MPVVPLRSYWHPFHFDPVFTFLKEMSAFERYSQLDSVARSPCVGSSVSFLSSLPSLSCVSSLGCRFFLEQNNRIFQTLLEVSASQDKTLTAEHARGMGLDPQGDRSFLLDLLEAYGIDVMLVIDKPCCP